MSVKASTALGGWQRCSEGLRSGALRFPSQIAATILAPYPIAMNLLSQDKSAKGGIRAKRLKAGWDNDYLRRVLTQ